MMETFNPQQLADEGQAEYMKAEYLSAARLFKAAADGFLTSGDELLAAEMANNCSVAFLKGGNAESALEAVMDTDRIFAAKGDTLREAMAIGNQAAALEKLKKLDQAVIAYEKSAELFKGLGESELRAYVLQSISSLQLGRGRYLEAYATMREGVMGLDKPDLKQRLLKSLMQIPFKFLG
jgi:tetratricopeptide (TPR) repeat protein